jgi:hypothetical protein
MDVRTGELLAIAEPARRSDAEPLLAFEPLLVGSVVKPLVAAAILTRQPQLAEMRLGVRRRHRARRREPAAGARLRERGERLRRQHCVHRLHPLLEQPVRGGAARALAARRRPSAVLTAPAPCRATCSSVPPSVRASPRRSTSMRSASARPAVTRDCGSPTSHERRHRRPHAAAVGEPAVARFPETDGTRLDLLARYAFGGWENRWTLLGLGEAYARIATGREVHATDRGRFVGQRRRCADACHSGVPRRVRTALRQVPSPARPQDSRPTLQRPRPRAERAREDGHTERGARPVPLARARHRGPTVAQTQASAALSCGLVAVSWFDFHDDAWPRARRHCRRSISSSRAARSRRAAAALAARVGMPGG